MKRNKKDCDLNSCFFCRGCLKDWLPAIEVHKKTRNVKKGELIFKEGDPVQGIFFINQGLVKVVKQWDADKELILRFAKDGDIIGHRGLGNEPIYPVSGMALQDSSICFIPLDFFLSSLHVNHGLTYELMLFFARELQESERKMRYLVHMPVKGRLAYALLLLQKKFGTTADGFIDITISQQDLASYIGTTYETVFRTFQEFTNQHLVEKNGKNFRITNTASLERIMTEQEG
ncbi:Crp/Fnr family transcriptional regulator [Flavihumibacter fluvii]|uniref:Crp/Fnr family transcriptional regulator n=1 Tax=Flavihumibacter fluvii TaxID=2838157 RepID=UPI001BDE5187|nr:cyclic nucleotide-binding domain-containing protein [Flavihumibacter fluvii]ULQ52808.1 cyclic nucleotide-binding domain-containing protein [Flavihumibacter fluvii]